MLAKIENEETKEVSVGIGDAVNFYKSIGMTEMDVEKAYNGSWYVKGFAPTPTDDILATQIRLERDSKIAATDYLAMPDYPLSEEERAVVIAYRQALRDLPTQEGFPREVVWPEVPVAFNRSQG